ncbi:type II toxin-antitoxin system VapC family toxin [Candidatus Woesearchaeota archaeon]|nr:type II toxin-antitoxin system VapC family toxin [Candidatus Woesearchaeota archaeon]
MAILDSSAIIHVLAGSGEGERIKEKFGDVAYATSAISVHEVLAGVSDGHRAKVVEFLKNIEILPFDAAAAFKSSELELHLKRSGRMICKLDILIASICLVRNVPLITTDNDFKKVTGLSVLTL